MPDVPPRSGNKGDSDTDERGAGWCVRTPIVLISVALGSPGQVSRSGMLLAQSTVTVTMTATAEKRRQQLQNSFLYVLLPFCLTLLSFSNTLYFTSFLHTYESKWLKFFTRKVLEFLKSKLEPMACITFRTLESQP